MTEKKWNEAIVAIGIPVAVVIVMAVIGIILHNGKKETFRNAYQETVELLEKCEYDEAITLLEERRAEREEELFSGAEESYTADMLRKQLKYESYAYSAVNSLKTYLKNPDSCEPYQIAFYNSFGLEGNWKKDEKGKSGEEGYPVCIMKFGAKNGFGRRTTGYALCVYSAKAGEYALLGTCPSLEERDYDVREDGEGSDLIICKLINRYREGKDKAGSISLDRLRKRLKADICSAFRSKK